VFNIKSLLFLFFKTITLDISVFQEEFFNYKESQNLNREPENLYKPISYILNLGGKKIRPVLTLMAAEIFSNNYKNALPAAYAIEMFHNFTLVHDDIMDDAPLRRGKETVHEKWDLNTGVLSGDAMLILAYQYFENYEATVFQKLAKLFSKTALEVCDGQQLDVDFETRTDVTIPEYIKMISLKTSVLIGAALKMGAIVSHADEVDAQKLYDFGLNLGIAFQLQDDYLDTFGNPETFGKQVGGDIIENKKTYLYLKTLETATTEDTKILLAFYAEKRKDNATKIEVVKQLFDKNNITNLIKNQITNYTNLAFDVLSEMNISNEKKEGLKSFGIGLMSRNV
jgi:geranylgeranyl diphosphate synthase type II